MRGVARALPKRWPDGPPPVHIAALAIAHSLLTLGGMLAFGRDVWLRHGESSSSTTMNAEIKRITVVSAGGGATALLRNASR